MSEKALYVLAGYDDKTEAYLSSIQNKLYERGFTGTHTKNIPQHITLGSFPIDMEDELVRLIRRQSTQLNSFEVTFNHIGVFGGGKVLFIAPDCSKVQLNLKEVFGTNYGWTPHTTMMIDEPDVMLKSCRLL